jgi:hypothetical protein
LLHPELHPDLLFPLLLFITIVIPFDDLPDFVDFFVFLDAFFDFVDLFVDFVDLFVDFYFVDLDFFED